MAIDKYSGLSQSEKFYARYGKAIGKDAVKRQKLHVASEAIKSEARTALQIPNYAANAQKPLLKLPNLTGGIYDTVIKNITEPQANKNASKVLNNIKKACDGKVSVNINETRSSILDKMAYYYKNLEKEAAKAEGAKALDKVKKACDGKVSVNISETRNSTLDKMAYYYKNLENASKPKGIKGFLGGLADGLKTFAKTKKGKIGLAAAALAAVVAGGVYLYNRNKDHNIPVSDSSPINDLANAPVNGEMTANGPYTVAKGDNIWCIARSHLMETHKDTKDYKPTDVEIYQHVEEIMKLNGLEYAKDSYKVSINVNQSLKLVA